jgi:hypothetical protein
MLLISIACLNERSAADALASLPNAITEASSILRRGRRGYKLLVLQGIKGLTLGSSLIALVFKGLLSRIY